MLRTVLTMGNPLLYSKVAKVTHFDEQLACNINDMLDTMHFYHGVGIAANQIGIDQQIILAEVQKNSRYPSQVDIPLSVYINPNIEFLSDQSDELWEGCLSVPGLRAPINRRLDIKISAYDQSGQFFTQQVSGFLSRVIQHEFDHLQGILFPQRLQDIKKLSFEENLT